MGEQRTRERPQSGLARVAGDAVGRPGPLVGGLALAAGVWAVVGSRWLFPYLSDDHDEGLYLLQGDALAAGHLFPPAPRQPDAFTPWLSVLSEGRYVLKYSPVHASFLAVGQLLGSPRWALGLVAAGVVTVTYLVAREALGDRRAAAVAAAFLALSPLFVVQSATFLPYCSNLLLLGAFVFTLLRGVRTQPRLLVASGFLLGLAAFARPFDALVFSVPLGLWFVLSQRRDRRRLAANAARMLLGAALPLVAMLAYYRAATGSPFRSPFALLEPQDTVGFGPRRLTPHHPELSFTASKGWQGVGRYAVLTSSWCFGGLVLMGFFVAGLVRGRARGPGGWLALAALSFAVGYAFFWGTYSTSLGGTLTAFLGPFYFLPVLLPLAVVAARAFLASWRRDRFVAALALGGMVLVSGYLLGKALPVNLDLSAEDRRLYASIARARLDRALVFLPPLYGPQLLHPFAWLRNSPHYDGPAVYALDRGDRQNLRLLEDFPGRRPYRFRVHGAYRANPPDPSLRTSLERLRVVEGPSLPGRLRFRNPTEEPWVVAVVAGGGQRQSLVLDTRAAGGRAYEVGVELAPEGLRAEAPVESRLSEALEPDGWLTVSVATGPSSAALTTRYERRVAYRVQGGSVRALLPGATSVDTPEAAVDLEVGARAP